MSSVLAVLGRGGTGKTALTANLAMAMAELLGPRGGTTGTGGSQVIAADFDLLTGDLAEHAAIENPEAGTTRVLGAEDPRSAAEKALIRISPWLSILPSGDPVSGRDVVASSISVPATVRKLAGMCTVLLLDFACLDSIAVAALPACTHALILTDGTPSASLAAERIRRCCSVAGVAVLGQVQCRLWEGADAWRGAAGILAALPYEPALPGGYGRRLLYRDLPGSPYSREVRRLAELLTGAGRDEREGDRWTSARQR